MPRFFSNITNASFLTIVIVFSVQAMEHQPGLQDNFNSIRLTIRTQDNGEYEEKYTGQPKKTVQPTVQPKQIVSTLNIDEFVSPKEKNIKALLEKKEGATLASHENAIKVFKKSLNKKIKETPRPSPQNLYDATNQLRCLFRNLQFLDQENKLFSIGENDLSIYTQPETAQLFLPPYIAAWVLEAIQQVLAKNKKIKKLINFVLERLVKNVTKDNKDRCNTTH